MASSTKALLGALAANVAIAVTKFVVGGLTGSSVMIAEGIHSLVDSGNSGLMIYGGRRSKRGPDRDHPFGHGMELYFWSLVVAMVVFGGGGGMSIYEGIHAITHPTPLTKLWPNYLVLGAAAVFEGASLYVGLREFRAYRREREFTGSMLDAVRKSKDPAMFLTVLEDGAALIGLAIAAVGVTLGHLFESSVIDGVASMLIGLVLMGEALLLGYECRGLIIGESARTVLVDKIRRVIERHGEVGKLEDLRTLQLGPESILVFLRIDVPTFADVAMVRQGSTDLIADLRRTFPQIRDVFFDVSPTPHAA
ncbi:MAG: cation diffusion facilitator family transporter [Kofleriaceae bacterium]|nr:cation diffusion facilitator family transporter [Kofleriaceae bacterium]